MSDPVIPPDRRPRRPWKFALPLAAMVVLAALWSVFWLKAASIAEATIARWQEVEAKLGRNYTCGSQTIGGYPFRIEVRCADAEADLQSAQPPVVIRAKLVLAVAQVYQPTLLISEITGPLTVEGAGISPLVANWSLAQASLRGTPSAPERASIVVDGLRLDQTNGAVAETLLSANRAELHARVDPASSPEHPTLDVIARLNGAIAPVAGPIAARPLDADVTLVLRGLKDFTAKPVQMRLMEFQAAGGRLQITQARFQQGDTLAAATGALGLTPQGRIEGAVQVTIAGLDKFLAAYGGSLAHSLQGFGQLPVIGGSGDGLGGLLGLLGQTTELEGRRAVAMPLRFTDGAAFLGPLRLGQIKPLY